MNESENYLDQLLNAVDGRSDLNDSDPVNPEEIESKEQMPQKSTRETIDIPDSNDLFMDQFEQELRKDNDPDEFLKQFEQELDRDESSQGVTKATQPMLDDIDQIMESVNQEAANDTAEMAASEVEKTAGQKEDTAEVKMMRVPVKMELMIWQSMISELTILDWMIRKQKTKKRYRMKMMN